jgi:hypothetical protein
LLQFDLLKIDWSAISALSTIFVAFLGYIINANLKRQQQQQEEFALLSGYRREVISFSERFFDLIARAVALHDASLPKDKKHDECLSIAAELSSLVDEGRFIFPNDSAPPNDFGVEKGPAFEGARRPVLDVMMAAYFATLSIGEEGDKNLRAALNELQRNRFPISDNHNPRCAKSILVESRRMYLNAIFPATFPKQWHERYQKMLGRVEKTSG